jgi:serine protease AprX
MKQCIKLLFIFLLCLAFSKAEADPAYAFRVRFKDKIGSLSIADSTQFLSPKALLRRSRQGIQLDSTDIPLVQAYIDTVMQVASAIKVHNKSKWFNQIVVIVSDSSKANLIQALPMVASVSWVAYYPSGIYKTTEPSDHKIEALFENKNNEHKSKPKRGGPTHYGTGFQQVDMIEADCIHDLGFQGEGMNIAVFDNSFKGIDTCIHFSQIFSQGRLKDQYDFARDTAGAFSKTIPASHGYQVISILGSDLTGSFVGSAPKANYFTYVTEDTRFEMPIEEDNWISAAEKADSVGVDLINSSLGYNKFDAPLNVKDYSYANMDGNTSMIVQGADMAVAKGIFVVAAAGNEGGSAWKYIITPADGDSVYTVGAVNGSGDWWPASSLGPTFDGRVKPDGMAMGQATTLLSGSCVISASSGTSFAAPVLCGGIACLWQSLPQLTVWQLRQLLKMSSDKYSNPNNVYGYGLPNLCLARGIVLGTNEVQQIDYSFTLFPNPSQGIFNLKSYVGTLENLQYQLHDISGKLIYASKKMTGQSFLIDALQQHPVGVYTLQIQAGGRHYQTKITKQ